MEIEETSKMARAFNDFNKVSKVRIPTVEDFSKLVSMSPKVRSWYQDWSFNNAAFTQMPHSFKDAGITPAQWEETVSVLPRINSVRKRASIEIEKAATEFSRFVEMKEQSVREELASLESPLIKILKVNVTCLSLEDQLSILAEPEERRSELELELLEKLRSKLLADLAKGEFKDPFIFGDFKELLL